MTNLSFAEILPWLPAAVAMVGAGLCWRCVRRVSRAIGEFMRWLHMRGEGR